MPQKVSCSEVRVSVKPSRCTRLIIYVLPAVIMLAATAAQCIKMCGFCSCAVLQTPPAVYWLLRAQ